METLWVFVEYLQVLNKWCQVWACYATDVCWFKDLGSVETSGRQATWVGWQEAIEAIRQKLKRFKAIPS